MARYPNYTNGKLMGDTAKALRERNESDGENRNKELDKKVKKAIEIHSPSTQTRLELPGG